MLDSKNWRDVFDNEGNPLLEKTYSDTSSDSEN